MVRKDGFLGRWAHRALGTAAVGVMLLAGCQPKKAGPVAGPGEEKALPPPGVYQINEDYDRIKSRVLIRRVVQPTLARLDFSAYDSNVLLHDPKEYKPNPPEKKAALADLDFGGSLEKETICDRLDEAPLTEDEKNSPMAWGTAREYLFMWDDGITLDLYVLGDAVSGETWNDDSPVRAYQEISRVYLHKGAGGYEMWAKVEFKPWVRFLEGIDDEDADGFPEIYGRLKRDAFPEAVADELIENYAAKVLSGEQVKSWADDLGQYWYEQYKTETLDAKEKKGWPDEKTKADVGPELAALPDEEPTVVMRGKPFERYIYLILYVEGMAEE